MSNPFDSVQFAPPVLSSIPVHRTLSLEPRSRFDSRWIVIAQDARRNRTLIQSLNGRARYRVWIRNDLEVYDIRRARESQPVIRLDNLRAIELAGGEIVWISFPLLGKVCVHRPNGTRQDYTRKQFRAAYFGFDELR